MKFSERKPKPRYPILGKTYEINVASGYEEADIKGKFTVRATDAASGKSEWLELWESQLDDLLPMMNGLGKGENLKIDFIDIGKNGKTKLIPRQIREKLD